MKNLKYLILGALILLSTADIFGQLATRYPTDVRYIGGGYIDKRPQFSTLEAALNDVKAYATVNRPYLFWVASDTVNIADWDSVFTESGLTMKDSINNYYVAEGKIKWAGFGFGGASGGGGGTIWPTQTETTTHYSYPNWDKDNVALALVIRYFAQALDSIDQHIWDLIVYTDSSYLYIENDTLKFRTATLSSFGARPDTTIIMYPNVSKTITGDWTIDGDLSINSGSIRLPAANNRTSTSRILWDSGNRPYYSGSGAGGDSIQLAGINPSTGELEDDEVVGYDNLVQSVIDSIKYWIKPPHASFEFDSIYTPAVTEDVYTKITPTFVQEELYRMTFAGDSLTIDSGGDGDYRIFVFFALYDNAGTEDYVFQIRVNDVAVHTFGATGAGAATYVSVATMHYEEAMEAGDDISLYVTNTANNNDPNMAYIEWYVERTHE